MLRTKILWFKIFSIFLDGASLVFFIPSMNSCIFCWNIVKNWKGRNIFQSPFIENFSQKNQMTEDPFLFAQF